MTISLRGWVPWAPKPEAQAVVDQVIEILADQSEYLPLSIRQIFYLGISRYGWPKTEKFYRNSLCYYMTRARRAEMIDFADIRDDGFTEERATCWSGIDGFKRSVGHWADQFKLDHDQDVIIWTEGKGLLPMVRRFADPYLVPVMSSGGFDSLTSKYQLAERYSDRSGLILHLGDYDPSGVKMFEALRGDIQAFGGDVEFRRIAVTRDQIDALDLPTAPPKRGTSHAATFDDDVTVQLEAIQPSDLKRIVSDAVTDALDMDAFRESVARGDAIREELKEWITT